MGLIFALFYALFGGFGAFFGESEEPSKGPAQKAPFLDEPKPKPTPQATKITPKAKPVIRAPRKPVKRTKTLTIAKGQAISLSQDRFKQARELYDQARRQPPKEALKNSDQALLLLQEADQILAFESTGQASAARLTDLIRGLQSKLERLRTKLPGHTEQPRDQWEIKLEYEASAPEKKDWAKLVVVDKSGFGSKKQYRQTVNIKNEGTETAVAIELEVQLFDAAGVLVAEGIAKGPRQLEPGQTAKYLAKFDKGRLQAVSRAEIKPRWR